MAISSLRGDERALEREGVSLERGEVDRATFAAPDIFGRELVLVASEAVVQVCRSGEEQTT